MSWRPSWRCKDLHDSLLTRNPHLHDPLALASAHFRDLRTVLCRPLSVRHAHRRTCGLTARASLRSPSLLFPGDPPIGCWVSMLITRLLAHSLAHSTTRSPPPFPRPRRVKTQHDEGEGRFLAIDHASNNSEKTRLLPAESSS